MGSMRHIQIDRLTRPRLLIALLLGGLLLAFNSAPAAAPGGDAAALQRSVEAVMNAYGGRAALAGVRTVVAQGHIDDFLRQTSGGYARIMRRPGGLRIDILPERGGEVRILSGGRGWQGSGSDLRTANPLALSSMRYQYGYLDLPMSLADGSVAVRDGGKRDLYGQAMKLLLVELAEAPQLRVYLDPATHLIRRVEADFAMGGMGTSQLGTEYEDFRPAAGVLFPRRLLNYAGGQHISTITIDRLSVNQPLPPGTFPAQ
jgi:hypothetical protein